MPPEQLGIVQNIEQAQKSPDKYAKFIAEMVVRVTLELLREKRKNSPGELTIEESDYLDNCDDKKLWKRYKAKTIKKQRPAIKALILEYAAGKTVEQIKTEYKIRTEAARDTREHRINTPAVFAWAELEAKSPAQPHTKDINIAIIPNVVRAVLILLADTIRSRKGEDGMHELAHYLHDQPHSEHILFDIVRQQLIDHGVIHANRIMHETWDNQQLWLGHDTSKKFEGAVSQKQNIITLLSKTGGQYSVKSLLRADVLYNWKSHILGQSNGTIHCYTTPKKDDVNWYTITPISRGFHFHDDMENVEHREIPQTPWDIYEISGKRPVDAKKNPKKTTICINREDPKKSLQSWSTVYKFEWFHFLILEKTWEITIFSSTWTTPFPAEIKDVIGNRSFTHRPEKKPAGTPNTTVNGFYFINRAGKMKKIISNKWKLEIVDISTEEEKFF